ncbi:MAG: AraC family transcriptional regulator [Sphingopyxis macrogoltabida]|uniref:AraC family transcriptional regulator n=1 Tax=Sphingopyxis macrogoltabida TaxID=33050 RepID=A0A2W5N886_SPHMC|nr:MAG: AraC family transcriptional regulator [Sphingopyxis macrogoltabida]
MTVNHSYALDTTWRTLLVDLGLKPADVLRRAGLPEDLLLQPSARLPSPDYYRLWYSIEELTGDPLLPLRLVEAVRAESFSPPLFAALCSPNLLAAVQRVERYKRLIGPIRFEVVQTPGRMTVEFVWLDAPFVPPTAFVMMELLFSVQLARMGTRQPIRPVEVMMTHPPAPLKPYEDFLGIRMTTGDRNSVAFAAEDAAAPFLTSNDMLWAAFEPDLRQRLADLDVLVTTAKRVHAALLEGLPSGLITVEAIATKLGLSKRTLQRRIEAEGTNFQDILKGTREALARHYLQKTRLPIAEISFLLGFDEPNSFHRAFRAWTGSTPDGLRR